ncbi:Peptidoglycan/LPS O-acetylase OafA/YrhL, contains acyltransferase and SGNH-hydrolase domains [Streptoalloteichus tenebrarius]|uniref:Peptidoglycan/LPS O-acetylase OafA/YrhL, contains acyltransferase and SGNH-hydrolase domains n=1 Tax=Streptoalloteichus tenebrarius (strain ATCC 17920 / DSM 40477 / JCM 4838 / CBS 697.72 / NBRC 16177 / NCIMB 11028 / NRRL B-12390 / A12253. 1 / ISP 5477) TaxID=1933 RepID=A0ABT1HNJ2_STRSD|nr:acyltransferase [Streptoalloteichus tenebrarius]MCP2257080.1 Peptidoglycan/LPS O-acetylase OafA/YrhL, contains acyltransferase and SGNH-hydrolase domains [Streptoalloteichus tenebrarius]BFE98711.1 acyltransferase [Streptoalloteichus tenebrarius]
MTITFHEHRVTTDDVRRPALPSLTGMRAVAAVSVFLFHLAIQAEDLPYGIDLLHVSADPDIRSTYLFLVGTLGQTAVSFFFVLSGFILTWSARPETVGRFWRRRLVKIYPLHLATYPLGVLLLTGAGTSAADVPGLFLVQSWIPDYRFTVAGNGPSWSISTELFFYLMFPLLLCWLGRVPPRRSGLTLVALVSAVVVVAVVSDLTLSPSGQVWLGYVFPPVRALEFVMGIVLARMVIAGRWTGPSLGWSAALLAAASVVALFVPKAYAFAAVTIVPVMLTIAAAARNDLAGRRGFLSTPAMDWLGRISFAFYLAHLPVLAAMRRLVGQDQSYGVPGLLLFVGASLAVTVLLAWALHVFVEKPAMRRWG